MLFNLLLRARRLALLVSFLVVQVAATADTSTGRQSFESCSMITSEYLTVLQLIGRGFDLTALQEALPGVSDAARKRMEALHKAVKDDGLLDVYSTVNSEYARCSRKVYQSMGVPPRQSREGHFHFCAGENKVRYEVLMAAMVGAPLQDVLPQLAEQHRPTARALYQLYEKEGTLPVFDNLASELKHCLNNNL